MNATPTMNRAGLVAAQLVLISAHYYTLERNKAEEEVVNMSKRGAGRSSGGQRKRMSVSYTIRDVKEPLNRAGINALAIDPSKKLLYTAGRDAVIRCWDISEAHGQKQCVSQTDYAIICNGDMNFFHFSTLVLREIYGTSYGLGQ